MKMSPYGYIWNKTFAKPTLFDFISLPRFHSVALCGSRLRLHFPADPTYVAGGVCTQMEHKLVRNILGGVQSAVGLFVGKRF